MDWHGECIVSAPVCMCKGKGHKYECSNSRGIDLLREVCIEYKLYGRVVIIQHSKY